jgi:septum formation inhibitor MinC
MAERDLVAGALSALGIVGSSNLTENVVTLEEALARLSRDVTRLEESTSEIQAILDAQAAAKEPLDKDLVDAVNENRELLGRKHALEREFRVTLDKARELITATKREEDQLRAAAEALKPKETWPVLPPSFDREPVELTPYQRVLAEQSHRPPAWMARFGLAEAAPPSEPASPDSPAAADEGVHL